MPCFSDVPGSEWANGVPASVTQRLNSDLILYHFEVSTLKNFDFGGVFPIYGLPNQYPNVGNLSNLPSSLVNITYGSSKDRLSNVFDITLNDTDRFFTTKLIDVRIGAKDRTVPLTVKYQYSGKDCSDRIVTVSRSIRISTIPTFDLSTMTDSSLQEYLQQTGRYYNIGDIKKAIQTLNYKKVWMNNTLKTPLPLIFPKGYKFPQGSWIYSRESVLQHIEGFSQLNSYPYQEYLDSNDGCLTNTFGEKYLHILFSNPYFKTSKTKCDVFLHIFSYDPNSDYSIYPNTSIWSSGETPASQLVIKGAVTSAKTLGKVKFVYTVDGPYCFNGKIFKLMKYGEVCPAGFVDTKG